VERGTEPIEKEKQRDDPERVDAKGGEQAACRELEFGKVDRPFLLVDQKPRAEHDHQRRDPRDQRRAMQGAGR